MEYVIILTIVLFGTLNAVLIWLFSRILGKLMVNGLNQLDSNLAEAIKKVMEGNFELPEQQNPLIAYFLESMKNKNQQSPDISVLSRDDQGKFA